jgi:nucleotide-binding universal stress UspA family protein
MSWKSILVHVDGRPGSRARIDLAARIAKQVGAGLAGIAVVAPMDLPQRLRSNPGVKRILGAEWRKAKAAAAGFAEEFAAQAGAAGFPKARATVVEGDAAQVLARAARAHDLVVLQQPGPDDLGALGGHFVEETILESGRPVLVVPAGRETKRVGRRILVAWKDARASAAALKDARPLLREAEQVMVLTVNEDDAAPDPEEALAYLALQGVEARPQSTRATEAGAAILRQARAANADLIVMGAYARPRLAELVLGGATRNVLEGMHIPVLMAH